MGTETSLVDPWTFVVIVGIAAAVYGLLETRVNDQRTALAAGLIAGIFVGLFTPAPVFLHEIVRAIRGLFG